MDKYQLELNTNITSKESSVDECKAQLNYILDAYTKLKENNIINPDLFYEQTATIESLLNDFNEEYMPVEEFTRRTNEVKTDLIRICDKCNVDVIYK